MGLEGGGGPFWEGLYDPNCDTSWSIYDHLPPDDPFAKQPMTKGIARAMKARFDDEIWKVEEIKPEEIPEELKESGAITVPLKDVKNSIGKDRAGWRLALEAELNLLMETGAVFPVLHLPKGAQCFLK